MPHPHTSNDVELWDKVVNELESMGTPDNDTMLFISNKTSKKIRRKLFIDRIMTRLKSIFRRK